MESPFKREDEFLIQKLRERFPIFFKVVSTPGKITPPAEHATTKAKAKAKAKGKGKTAATGSSATGSSLDSMSTLGGYSAGPSKSTKKSKGW